MKRSLLVLMALASPASADCEVNPLLDRTVITPTNAALVGGGGFLIADLPAQRMPRTTQPTAKTVFSVRGQSVKERALAPGLAVIEPKASTTPIELADGDGTIVARVTTSNAKAARYPAPSVKAVRLGMAGRYHVAEHVTLSAPVPADTYALIVADAKGTPRSFIRVTPGAKEITATGSNCQRQPDGTVISQERDKIVLSWVSTTGRLSAKSKVLTVGVQR